MRIIRLGAGLALAACSLAACSGGSSSDGDRGELRDGGTFTMALSEDFGSFDPYSNPNIAGLSKLAYDSLVNLQPDGKFVSGLAKEWKVSAKSATFTLKDDVTCSDGSPLTASQVADDISYVADPDNKSAVYGSLVPAVALKATGDNATGTVQIDLEQPFGFLLNTVGQLPVVCKSGLSDLKSLATTTSGTGPYVLKDVSPGESYTFDIRKGYSWGPDGAKSSEPGMPATVVVRVVEDETTRANLLLSGELNFAKIEGEDRSRLDSQRLEKLESPIAGAWLRFNQRDSRPSEDPRVRQALTQSLDFAEVIKVNTGGAGEAATGMVTASPLPCTEDSVSGAFPKYDVKAAGALLDEAGWVLGKDGKRQKDGKPLAIDLHYLADWSVYNRATAEFMAQQWKTIGVDVKLTADTLTGLTDLLLETADWDILLDGQGLSLPTQVVPWYSGALPADGLNVGGVENKDYESLVQKASPLAAPDACEVWADAEKALYSEFDVVPIAQRFQYSYLQKASVEAAGTVPAIPTSIRLYK